MSTVESAPASAPISKTKAAKEKKPASKKAAAPKAKKATAPKKDATHPSWKDIIRVCYPI